ncbi:hypothetical protein HEK616_40560 [Streptomyces nigrescens]|uniref:Uncharacterized protein n=1 Tax=Streptomyces nigrescens TaxID=1920 RepID=A0ABM7ZW21_STRNI|nr:hypothetical protein [Streptomyces nigrescens]BDM70569.1 hypothetical protein HEK616_40560 [Streptomyces nigrescens]
MTYETGHFYRDRTGDVWQAVSHSALLFIAFAASMYDDVEPFDVVPASNVEGNFGPLVEVTPTWTDV